jgi:2-polyprenyl-3-methyl-5-hydroxy-6-metoxy-1,4-benzoquinol methylase
VKAISQSNHAHLFSPEAKEGGKIRDETAVLPDVNDRARRSLGISSPAIYQMVSEALTSRHAHGEVFFDIGCGTGNMFSWVRNLFRRYVGVDTVRYDGFPIEAEFVPANLDSGQLPLYENGADVVAAVETIEHLENPRAFVRELTRLTRPGGWIVVTTPNQISLLSKATLLVKNQFNAFQNGSYPAHLTALLEVDLRRIANEAAWEDIAIHYSKQGRLIWTSRSCPKFLSQMFPRAFSDNVLLIGRKAA